MSQPPDSHPALARVLHAKVQLLYPIRPSDIACVPNGSQFDVYVDEVVLRVTVETLS